MKRRIILFLISIAGFLNAEAQDYVIGFKRWSVKEGLPHRQVNCLYQDRIGLLWIGTPYGLTRFDGYSFINYLEPSDGTPYKDIISVAEDATGKLWLSCRGAGKSHNTYLIFDPLTYQAATVEAVTGKALYLPFGSFNTLADSSILVSGELNAHTFNQRYANTFYRWHTRRGWDTLTLPAQSHSQVLFDENECLAAITDNGEINMFDLKGRVVKRAMSPFSSKSLFWFRRIKGDVQYVLDKTTQRMYTVSGALEIKDVTDILPAEDKTSKDDIFSAGPDGNIWRQGKLFTRDHKPLRDFVKEGLIEFGNQNRAIIRDNRGRIWLGNDFGLYRLQVNRNKFKHYLSDSTQLSNYNSCRGIVAMQDSLYVNTQINGLFIVNRKTNKTSVINPVQEHRVSYGILKTKRGDIFTYTKGLLATIRSSKIYPYFDGRLNHCWSMYEMDTGRFLLGLEAGLAWFNTSTGTLEPFAQYNNFKELANHNVIGIYPGNNGRLYLCSSNGLYEYDARSGITARYSSTDTGIYYLPASDFHHLFIDTEGIWWLSATQGLIKWDKTRHNARLFSRATGLSNNNIYAAYPDDYGYIWLSSDYGIMRFDKGTGEVKTYLTTDGITHNEFNRIAHFRDQAGNIYFGSLNGITSFHPRSFIIDTAGDKKQSPLVITSFQQFNGEINRLENRRPELLETNTITLYPQDRFFTLEFTLVNYSEPELTTYYWKIDGVDSGWNVQEDRAIRLSRLPYGNRLLHIKAQESDGTWSANELIIQLRVIRPFYLQPWFLILVVIMMVCGIAALYKWRVYLLKKENVRLDKTVLERTADLQQSLEQKSILLGEIHHRVKNNLQMICSLLELQAHKIVDSEAKVAFEESQSRVMSIAIIHEKLYQNELFNSLDFRGFIADLFTQIQRLTGEGQREIQLDNNYPGVYYDIDIAIPLGLILNELITNSIKHAGGKVAVLKIKISLGQQDGFYVLIYEDNGPGLPADFDWKNSTSLGLQLVHMQSLQLDGYTDYQYRNGSRFSVFFKT